MIKATPVRELKGIGEKSAKLFEKLDIYTAWDLISYYPRGYDNFEPPVTIQNLTEDKVVAIKGHVRGNISMLQGKSVPITNLMFEDTTSSIKVTWYRMPYVKKTMSYRGEYILRGLVKRKGKQLLMEQPEIFYPIEKYYKKMGSLWPIYSLTKGLSNNKISTALQEALHLVDIEEDYLSRDFQNKYHLESLETALHDIHFPRNKDAYQKARRRLVFDEFLTFIMSLQQLNMDNAHDDNAFVISNSLASSQLIDKLSYSLTKDQQMVYNEIKRDMASSRPMSRLIQGDVGCGKTILAILALIDVAQNGYQGAFMVPTEVLARQHYDTIKGLLLDCGFSFHIDLLTGAMTAKEKREVYERLEKGETQILIGTHALIQEKTQYQSLALVITDEQHRFGVRQRETFAKKGGVPHVLVMSATPIPRTLAIILYGDLDISVIREMPKNRLPIKSCVVGQNYRQTAYKFMQREIANGHQGYIICPMVEESEIMEAENVLDYAQRLKESLDPAIRIAYLHGKMKPDKKDEIMNAFNQHETDILVSTTVIEVGIDVANATFIMIENAERFGLAQLHQLRGRVGRGQCQSYCIFISGNQSEATKERLSILNKTTDGFEIANEDLKLRGPGDLFGIRQSGLMNFKLADIFSDATLLKEAANAANEIENIPVVNEIRHGTL